MDKDKTTFIRATLKNAIYHLEANAIPMNTISRIKVEVANDALNYNLGNVENEIFLLELDKKTKINLDNDEIHTGKNNLIRYAKMVVICLSYLPHYSKSTQAERLYAKEWRRLEREITIFELNEMQASHDN
jgi:hypothetical protein